MRKSKSRKILKISLISLGILLFTGLVSIYILKGYLLDKAISRIRNKMQHDYALNLQIGHYTLKGFTEVNMQDIYCITADADTLASFGSANVKVDLLASLSGKPRLNDIYAGDGFVDLGLLKNMRAVKAGEEQPDNTEQADTSKFARLKKYVSYFKTAADLLPSNCALQNIRMQYADSLDTLNTSLSLLSYKGNELDSRLNVMRKGKLQEWQATGSFNRRTLATDIAISSTDTSFYHFNFIRQVAKADIGFRRFSIKIDDLKDDEDEINIKGEVGGEGVFLYNENLSQDTLYVSSGLFAFQMLLDRKKIVVDSSSSITLNELHADMGAQYTFDSPQVVKMKLKLPWANANTFLRSLPAGAFNTLRGFDLEGELAYDLDFYVNLSDKDSVKLDSDLEGKNLKIASYGDAQLNKLNTSFTYIPYNSKRHIIVGPENPSFTPIEQISPLLKYAVMTAEDPGYYYHKGFVQEALEQSILENLQEGEFKRGGSTISMQLVKNVFLTHKKTIDRKLEEALLVWLIENLRISSKERMFEVYLNIIEWGPGIYGIGEATRFYFNKSPMDINLSEALFLAYIVRRPLKFMYNYDEYGMLRDYVKNRLRSMAFKMYHRQQISEDDYGTLWIKAPVSGQAQGYMRILPKLDSTTIMDTISVDDW